MPNLAKDFLEEFRKSLSQTIDLIDWTTVLGMVAELRRVREAGGRVFVIGLGGSAGNASHMVNDLRKLAGIEAYSPTDNVSEFTARANDDGWGSATTGILRSSKLRKDDVVFVLSVGGGDVEKAVSTELVNAVDYSIVAGARVLGIVGRDGGHVAKEGHCVVVVPPVNSNLVTPLAEALQGVIWHFLVSHPDLAVTSAHWESLGSS